MLLQPDQYVIKVRAPTRIDLAGGTLDIYPIHQFMYPRIYSTVNMAISIYNYVELKKLETSRIIIKSVDLGEEIEFDDLNSLHSFLISDKSSPLMLAIKSIYFFNIEGIELITKSEAPRGSGLGNSSSLLVAIISALNLITENKYEDEEVLEICQAIETSVLKIPTGSQDYIAALYGGLNRIEYGLTDKKISQLPVDMIESNLQKYGTLCYIGQPERYKSPIENPNWDIFKTVVERKDDTLFHLNKINEVANDLVEAINREDWVSVIDCFARESEHRTKLTSTLASDFITFLDQIGEFDIDTYKICGAGGGGCILLISPDKEKLESFFKGQVPGIIDFQIDQKGLEILESK